MHTNPEPATQPRYVGYYDNHKDTSGEAVTVTEVLDAFRTGRYADDVQRCRDHAPAGDEAAYKAAKSMLPAVTFAGTFRPYFRIKEGIDKPSGFIVLDFDGLSIPEACELRDRLKNDVHIYAAFRSVGHGVKALLRIDVSTDAELKSAWPTIAARYPTVDGSGCDINRLCYVSHDPDLWVNESAQPLPVSRAMATSAADPVEAVELPEPLPVSSGDNPDAIRHVANIVRKGIASKKKSVGESRHAWMRNACITAHRYINGGYLTASSALAAIRHEYAVEFGRDPERMRDVDRAFKWAADVAKTMAPKHPKAAGHAGRETQQQPSVHEVTEDRIELLLQSIFTPAAHNEPEHIPAVLTFADEVEVAHAGSITMAVASYSTGKSTVAAAIWSAYYVEPANADKIDTLGFRVTQPEGRPYALYFDTEQAHRESWHAWMRAMKRSMLNTEHEDAAHTYINLHDMPSNIDRQAVLWWYLEVALPEPTGLVIIDGIADLIHNVNDAVEVDEFMQRLRTCVSRNGIAAVVTIHENPGMQSKARGHLGSDLIRRASSILRLEKDRSSGRHTITVEKARNGKSFVKWSFEFDEDARTHVSIGKPGPKPSVYDPKAVALAEAMQPGFDYQRKQIDKLLADRGIAPEGITDAARQQLTTRTIKKAVDQGLLVKIAAGQYRKAGSVGDVEEGLF